MALGTPYLAIAEHTANVFASGALPNVTQQHLYADATGVGVGVVELIGAALKEKLITRDVSLRPITITYGQGEYRLGSPTVTKHGLVTRLIELMATDTIKVAKSLVKDVPLIDELKAFQERVAAETGNTSFGGRGAHDDTVISLCLSVITDPFKYRVTYSPRVF